MGLIRLQTQGVSRLYPLQRVNPSERAALLIVALLGGVLGVAVLAHGGTVADAWAGCEIAIGVLLIAVVLAERRLRGGAGEAIGFPVAVLALPVYAWLQVVPLPVELVAILSPVRVELHQAVSSLGADPAAWIPVSVHPGETFRFAIRLAAYPAVFWIVRWLTVRLGRYAFAAAAPIVGVAVVQAVIAITTSEGSGVAGSYVNRNHLAGLLEMALPFGLVTAGFFVRRVLEDRQAGFSIAGAVLSGAAVFQLGAGLLATRSRAGLVASLAGVLVVGLLAAATRVRAARRQRLALAVSVPVLVGAALVYLPSDNLVRRYGALLARQGMLHEGRVLLWRETVDLAAAYPIVGCGFGAYESAFPRYKRSAPMVNDNHAHNDYLELLAEAGVIGLVLCIVLAAAPAACALRASLDGGWGRRCALGLACIGSLAAIAAHSLVDFNLRIPANGMVLFWIFGISAACGRSAATPPNGAANGAAS